MKLPLLLVLSLVPGPAAFAAFGVLPLDMAISQSAAVLDATLLSARSVGYSYRSEAGICGHVYQARINESFKGELSGTITFASDEAMAPQSRLLLFLRSYEGDFPRDSDVSIEDPDDPDFDANLRKARKDCLATLPRLKSTFLFGGRFVSAPDARSQFVSISHWLRPPPSSQPRELGEQTQVPWEPLRAWLLLRAPELLDGSRVAIECDDDCIGRDLAAATAMMNRNLDEDRRWRAGEPAALAALEASQVAWREYMRTACRSAAMIWRDSRHAAALSLECPLHFTQTRARELWMLRDGGECEYEFDECDAASLEREAAGVAASMRDQLEVYRRMFAYKREVLALMEADQGAWEAYQAAACRAFAAAWREGEAGPRARSCRLRQARNRHGEMYWQYQNGIVAVARRLGDAVAAEDPAR